MSVHLSRKLALEDAVRVADGAGGFSENWVVLGTLWAEVEAGAGRERFGAGVTKSTVPYKITVRAAPVGAASRPKPEQRFREGARVFRIIAVADHDHTAAYLTCFATEELAG